MAVINRFNSETGAAAAIKKNSGAFTRWADKDPNTVRKNRIFLSISDAEKEFINQLADSENISKAELVVRAVRFYSLKKSLD